MADEGLLEQFKKTKPGDLGIIGDPIDHSLSPVMHNAAFQTWRNVIREKPDQVPHYHKFHVKENQLKEAMELIKKFRLLGVNVTIPHKVSVNSFMDKLDPFVQKVGAVNTIVVEDGKLAGFNTDGYGFRFSLEADLGFEPEGKKVLILGAGGVGRVIAHQLQSDGVNKIFWWDVKIDMLSNLVKNKNEELTSVELLKTEDDVREVVSKVDLVVNATPVGMHEGDELPVRDLKFKQCQAVFDAIYNRKTRFMEEASHSGAFVTGGLGMLIYQGVQAFRLWTKKPAPIEVMRLALANAMKKD